jgi:hypothetical protein
VHVSRFHAYAAALSLALLASCTATATPPGGADHISSTPSSAQATGGGSTAGADGADFCAVASRVSRAIGTFGSSGSRAFDGTAKAQAGQLLSEVAAASKLASSPEMRSALTAIDAAVRSIVSDADASSSSESSGLVKAAGQYVQSTVAFKTLMSNQC